jgi:hypothetical protein
VAVPATGRTEWTPVPDAVRIEIPATKMAMVREAMAALGDTARPSELVGFIQRQYGVAMVPAMASAYKSMLQRPARKTVQRSKLTSEERKYLRDLIDRVGAEQVQQVVDEMEDW